jgi:hypothetical protein
VIRVLKIRLNYYALTVSILTGCMVETAFEKLQSDSPSSVAPQINDLDIADMKKLKSEGETYKSLGEIYDMTPTAIFNRIKRARPPKTKRPPVLRTPNGPVECC